jgi:glucose/arabinose dehydrogenase
LLRCLLPAPFFALAFTGAQAGEDEAPLIRSGYAIGKDRCGEGPSAFPKVRIGMRAGYCAGLVASRDDGLVFPRSIVQVPGTRFFVVADMGGWDPQRGRMLLLDPEAPEGKRLKTLLTKLDLPHGLAVGIDRRVYVGTVDRIFRFDPLADRPDSTVETIVQDLPPGRVTPSDEARLKAFAHPLKPFVFDRTGRLYVNIGAPTDSCATRSSEAKPCAAAEGANPLAAVWAFTPPAGGVFPALKPGEKNPPREVLARGLRNSLALAPHPRFPDAGFTFLQAENARDLPDPTKPNEELNALEPGKHYGWPYCYDLATPSPEYKAFLEANGPLKRLCSNAALYRPPHSLMPPHAAPLAMLYYQGDRFSELAGKLVVALHGYRPTGGRVIVYDVDDKGLPPVSPPPVQYRVSCAAEPTRTFQTDQAKQVSAAPFHELIGGWHKVNGVRPRGAPVGMTVAADGALWLVEDKNQAILRIDAERAAAPPDDFPCDERTPAQIKELTDFVAAGKENRSRLTTVRTRLIEKHCADCHSAFGLKGEMSDAQKDAAVLAYLLAQDGWVYPGDPQAGRLHARVWGKGAEKIMPERGRELIAGDPTYRALLRTLDRLVETMVPGERRRIKARGVAQKLVGRSGRTCGSVPDSTVVVVVERRPKEKPGYSRIFRPADQYLDGECRDDEYYVDARRLVAL